MRVKSIIIAIVLGLSSPKTSAQLIDTPALWRQAIGGRVLSSPQAQAGSVALLSDDRSVRAYSSSGALLWRYQATERLAPCIHRSPEGSSYFGTASGVLIALNRSGRELWKRAMAAPPLYLAIGWDGRIFAVSTEAVWCFSASGLRKWRMDLSAPPSCEAILSSEGGLIVATLDGAIHVFSPFGEMETFPLGLSATTITANEKEIFLASESGLLYRREGVERFSVLKRFDSAPIALKAINEALAYCLSCGEVGLISLLNNEIIWKDSLPKTGSARLQHDERGWFFLTLGAAAAYKSDGERLWRVQLEASAQIPTFSDDGLLFSGGKDWILYAYRIEERVLSKSGSIYAPFPVQGYGLAAPPITSLFRGLFGIDTGIIEEELSSIEKRIRGRTIAETEPDALLYLIDLVSSALNPVGASPYGNSSIPIIYRVRAISQLGVLGSRDHIPILVKLFRDDKDPLVRAEAALAIGGIGVDPSGLALEAFAAAANPPGGESEDRVLLALVKATEALCLFSGPPLSDKGIPLLVNLAEDTRSPSVRSEARYALKRLIGR